MLIFVSTFSGVASTPPHVFRLQIAGFIMHIRVCRWELLEVNGCALYFLCIMHLNMVFLSFATPLPEPKMLLVAILYISLSTYSVIAVNFPLV